MHCPNAAGAGIGTKATADTLLIIGDILVRCLEARFRSDWVFGLQIPPADCTSRADGLTEMTVTAGGAGQTAVGLILLGCIGSHRQVMGDG